MKIDIRPLGPQDIQAVLTLGGYAFASAPESAPVDMAEQINWETTFGVRDPQHPGELCGMYTSFDLAMTIPGPRGGARSVPLSGLSWVGVHPDVRRRGVLSAMMRHYLAAVRERGIALCGLHATETGIYGRFGFGVASHDVTLTLPRGARLAAPAHIEADAEQVQTSTLFDIDSPECARRLSDIDTRCAGSTLGFLTLSPNQVRANLRDVPAARPGQEPRRALIATRQGVEVGAAIYSRKLSWEEASPAGEVMVYHLAALDAPTHLALCARLLDMDLAGSTTFSHRGLSDPLLAWSNSPRDAKLRVYDGLWLRPAILEDALGLRGYACAADLVLEVTDAMAPSGAQRVHLTIAADGVARTSPTQAEPDLRLDMSSLAGLYLGLQGAAELHAAGLIQELRPAAAHELGCALDTGIAPIGGASF
ncbi:GNAT family N-acetyltransferase [Gephyromycinifex aptenodytis]|uniref:GNAT family N-acetyltransferase n=1 Tax=Gephyromycinifex aptenodytis TaxID=2716227 RepID=UPI001448100B|nr:GNAT family N-acetyltransferase [Gephyromycinifex aptenodytis]